MAKVSYTTLLCNDKILGLMFAGASLFWDVPAKDPHQQNSAGTRQKIPTPEWGTIIVCCNWRSRGEYLSAVAGFRTSSWHHLSCTTTLTTTTTSAMTSGHRWWGGKAIVPTVLWRRWHQSGGRLLCCRYCNRGAFNTWQGVIPTSWLPLRVPSKLTLYLGRLMVWWWEEQMRWRTCSNSEVHCHWQQWRRWSTDDKNKGKIS